MRYTYFDILFDMAQANVAPTPTLRLHLTHGHVRWTDYGPTHSSSASYITPDGDARLDAINRRA